MGNCFRIGLVALLSVLVLCAQNPTGRITGRVIDPTGAVVPGATVKAINIGTNVEASIRTTSEGNFALLNLNPGQYRLEVAMTGFKGFEQGPIELHVGDILSIAVTMQLGAETESVTVTSEAPLLGVAKRGAGPGGNHQTNAESPDAREQRAFYRDVRGEPDYHLADGEPLRSVGEREADEYQRRRRDAESKHDDDRWHAEHGWVTVDRQSPHR